MSNQYGDEISKAFSAFIDGLNTPKEKRYEAFTVIYDNDTGRVSTFGAGDPVAMFVRAEDSIREGREDFGIGRDKS